MVSSPWLKWPLIVVGIIVGAFVVMYAAGALLPASHTATASAELEAPPERVWSLIAGIERFPEWRPDVEGVTRLEDRDGLPAWRETLGTGRLTFRAEAWEPPRLLVARIADPDLPFGGTWTYEIEPVDDGSLLTITERGEVRSPVFRFMSRFLFGHDSTIRAYLDAVRAELGTGPDR